ncbi:hypothetical protein CRT60_22025 [Azospirillum palustre]|uniref:Uncharacterized protein n=1 Tax=Azospirillum palustre TaxID=2044885 RepID=A0A2B8BDC1_9PROT|nr:hypothetical protein [Azospirillum palustre]PGH55931.1 hypothetical protein CRT60_22025 [Azospirillum palustre]
MARRSRSYQRRQERRVTLRMKAAGLIARTTFDEPVLDESPRLPALDMALLRMDADAYRAECR